MYLKNSNWELFKNIYSNLSIRHKPVTTPRSAFLLICTQECSKLLASVLKPGSVSVSCSSLVLHLCGGREAHVVPPAPHHRDRIFSGGVGAEEVQPPAPAALQLFDFAAESFAEDVVDERVVGG